MRKIRSGSGSRVRVGDFWSPRGKSEEAGDFLRWWTPKTAQRRIGMALLDMASRVGRIFSAARVYESEGAGECEAL